jgi:phage FluMu protein Com
MGRDKREPVQIKCPRCKFTTIIYIPLEQMPRCPECNTQMNIEELLDEGKAY